MIASNMSRVKLEKKYANKSHFSHVVSFILVQLMSVRDTLYAAFQISDRFSKRPFHI
jgi:hypothetical protein